MISLRVGYGGCTGLALRLQFMFKRYKNVRKETTASSGSIHQQSQIPTKQKLAKITKSQINQTISPKSFSISVPNTTLGGQSSQSIPPPQQFPQKQQNAQSQKPRYNSNPSSLSQSNNKNSNNDKKVQKISKQSHQIFKTVKNSNKLSQLFYLLRKYSHKVKIQQILAIFQKIVYVDNVKIRDKSGKWHQNTQEKYSIEEKFGQLVAVIQKLMFKTAYAPQIYVKFISSFSKTQNQYLICKCFPIFIKILKNQLNLSIPAQQSQPQSQSPKTNATSSNTSSQSQQIVQDITSSPTLSQVISLQNNIRLLRSLLRIYNHRLDNIKLNSLHILGKFNQKQFQIDCKIIQGFIKQVIKYVHIPAIHQQVQTRMLFQVILQYIVMYPGVKLGNSILKAVIRDGLTRIKREQPPSSPSSSRYRTIASMPQSHKIGTIKKLLILQRLLLQQTRRKSMVAELHETKGNNIQYNNFYMIQRKLNKSIINLLPQCKFNVQTINQNIETDKNQNQKSSLHEQNNPNQQNNKKQQNMSPNSDNNSRDTLWQHSEVLPLLIQHIKLIFVQMDNQIISKLELTSQIYKEYQSICSYLSNLIIALNYRLSYPASYRFNNGRQIVKLMELCWQLMQGLLRMQVVRKLPPPVVQKCVNGVLVGRFMGDLNNNIPAQFQIVLLQYLLRANTPSSQTQKSKQKSTSFSQLVLTLVNSILQLIKSKTSSSSKSAYKNIASLYIKLLMSNTKYQNIIKQNNLQEKQNQVGVACAYGVINCIDQCTQSQRQGNQTVKKDLKDVNDVKDVKYGENKGLIVKELSGRISKYIYRSAQKQVIMNNLLQLYMKQSTKNCMFTNNEIDVLRASRNNFSHRTTPLSSSQPNPQQSQSQGNNFSSFSSQSSLSSNIINTAQSQKLHKSLINRIKLSYKRVQFMLYICQQIYGNQQKHKENVNNNINKVNTNTNIMEKYQQYLSNILIIFDKQSILLNYQKIKEKNKQCQRVNKIVEEFRNKLLITKKNKSTTLEKQKILA